MRDIEHLAREAGFVAYGEDCGEYRIPTPAFKHRMEWFAALVRNEVLEEAAKVCDDQQNGWPSDDHLQCASAIRALKDKK